jgi:tetratricopeptide (TPR) repeat protein
VLLDMGRAHEAAEALEEAYRSMIPDHRGPYTRENARCAWAQALASCGESQRARELLAQQPSGPGAERGKERVWQSIDRAKALIALGEDADLGSAEEALAALEARLRRSEGQVWLPQVLVEQARLAQLRGDRAGAEAKLREAARRFDATGADLRAAQVRRVLGEA